MATSIPVSQARAAFTSNLVDVFEDMLPAPSFLRSFFPSEQSFTRYVSIQVERNYETIAADVQRGTGGQRNSFAKSTEKVFDPPYFKEWFDITDIDLYDRLFGSTSIDSGVFSQVVQTTARRLSALRAKIERKYEKMIADALTTGAITLVNTDSVNFGRVAGSLVDKGAGAYWATDSVNPFNDLENGCQFLRETGKAVGTTFHALLGQQAFRDMQNNAIYKARVLQNLNNNIDLVLAPQRQSTGATFHGILSCGNYKVCIWTYPQSYDVSGTPTAYLDTKKVIIIPEVTRFKLSFAAVPQLAKVGNGLMLDSLLPGLDTRAFVPYESIDDDNDAHKMGVKSAGLPILTAVDQAYTVQVVA
jgi:hypothetical protein